MRMAVGVAQLVSHSVNEQIPSLAVEINDQALEDIAVGAVGSMGQVIVRGRESLGPERLDAVRAHVDDERVHQLDVVVGAGVRRGLQVRPEVAEEGNGRAGLDVRVQVVLELVRYVVDVGVGDLGRGGVDVGDHVDLEVGRERVGQLHAAREGAEDEIAQLDAVGGDDVAELVVAVAEELGEVVQEDEEETQCALVEEHDRLSELDVAEEGRLEAEQLREDGGVHVPLLEGLVGRGLTHLEHLGDEDAVGDELEPGVGESGRLGRPDDVVDVDEGVQDVVEDGLEVVLGQGGLEEEHVEEAVEGHGLEVGALVLLVVEQAAGDEAQDLVEQVDLVDVVGLVARVLDKEDDELDEGVQALVALGAPALVQVEVAGLDADLGADAEEARDHLVGLEHALGVHLEDELLEGLGVLLLRHERVVLDPVVEQLVAFLFESGRVVELLGLLDACVHHGEGRGCDPVACLNIRGFKFGTGFFLTSQVDIIILMETKRRKH